MNAQIETVSPVSTTVEQLEAAYQMYVKRQNRTTHPAGKFDKAGRWYPAGDEVCSCCTGIRNPSRAWPFSLMTHCRTAEHIANLCNVDAKALRRLIRTRKDQ